MALMSVAHVGLALKVMRLVPRTVDQNVAQILPLNICCDV